MSFLTTPTKCSGKRTRRQKSTNKSLKRRKTENVDDEENHLRDCFSSSSSTSDEDENEEENHEEEIDWKKLEEVLEESAQKANLTAVNVKSILHVSDFPVDFIFQPFENILNINSDSFEITFDLFGTKKINFC